MRLFLWGRCCLTAALVFAAGSALAADNLVKNGGFSEANDIGLPAAWAGDDVGGVKLAEEDGNVFLRVTNETPKRQPQLQQTVAVPADAKQITLSARLRCGDLKPGELHWQTGRVAGQFLDEQGEVLGWLTATKLERPTKAWTQVVKVTDVPEATASIRLMAGLFFATGTLDVDDITLTVGDHAPAKPKAAAPAAGPTPVAPADGDNLLPNPSFEESVDGKLKHWHMAANGLSVVKEGDDHFLRATSDNAKTIRVATMLLKVDPQWQRLKMTGKLRSTELKPNDRHWQTGRVSFTYLDADQEVVKYLPHIALREPTEGWVSQEVTHEVPIGAVYIRIEAGMFMSTGQIDIDELKIERADEQAKVVPHWGQEPVEVESPLRATVCLNGAWRFRPVAADEGALEAEWGWAAVPGSWHRLPTWERPGLMTTHRGPVWNAFLADRQTWTTADYERELTVPADWAGRRVELDLAYVVSVAEVWIDGTRVGQTEHGFGKVDITDHAKPGKPQKLTLRVHALPDAAAGLILMGETVEQLIRKEKRLSELGLIGDVLLTSRPHGPHVADVFVKTSVRDKAATLELQLADWPQAGPVEVVATMLSESGEAEQRFVQTFDLDDAAKQAITMRCDWPEPRLWDVGQPNLYTLDLQVRPAGQDESIDHLRQRFGFREFWIEGRHFMLNGSRINLRPSQFDPGWPHLETVDLTIRRNMGLGFTISYSDGHTPGATPATGLVAQRADELGHMIIAWTPNMAPLVVSRTWDDAPTRLAWQHRMADHFRRLQNHPSIVMWATSANTFGHGQDQNPRYLGNSDLLDIRDEDPAWWRRARPGLEAIDLIKKQDPTRPTYAHSGSFVGDLQVANMYLNLIPLQEREEWLSHWAQHADRPFMAGEFGLPLNNTWTRGKAGGGWTSKTSGSWNSQPLMTEYLASYLGPSAYAMESDAYRATIPAKHTAGEVYTHALGQDVANDPAHHAMMNLFIRNTYRSWRTWGLSGGTVPWAVNAFFVRPKADRVPFPAFEPGRRGEYVESYPASRILEMVPEHTQPMPPASTWIAHNQDTLMWIAGHHDDNDPASFTGKTHHYRAGDTFAKQIVLINDARSASTYRGSWELRLGEQVIASGQFDGEIEPGLQSRRPVRVDLPAVQAVTRMTLHAEASIGESDHADTFELTVFPARPQDAVVLPASVELIDPAGHTTRMLESLNVEAKGDEGGAASLIVLGRESLSSGKAELSAHEARVAEGATLLVMAQHPDWLRKKLDLRVAPFVSRRVFATQAGHPVLDGLDEDMLRDWAGTSTLVEPRPEYPVQPGPAGLRYYAGKPIHGWRWGNRHGITSAAIEKPHLSGWRAILDAEFDLAYSPLMELRHGRGRVILCTLDLEDHVDADPAAARLARQLLTYAANPATKNDPQKVGSTAYRGGEAGRDLLTGLGLRFSTDQSVLETAGLIVLGEQHGLSDEAIVNHLAAGQNVFVLPASAYPLGLGTQAAQAFPGSLAVPAWPQTEGLGVSVFRRHVDQPGRVFTASEGFEIAADGMLARTTNAPGVLLAAQFDPEGHDTDAKPYLRYVRWRDTRALTVLLGNLGATFEADGLIFQAIDATANELPLAGAWQAALTHPLDAAPAIKQAHPDPGVTELAKQLIADDGTHEAWQDVQLPAEMETLGAAWHEKDGEAVFRKTISVPEHLLGRALILQLGPIDDFDRVYLNGQLIGETGIETEAYWSANRRYPIPADALRPGDNTIVIRAFDRFGGGGVMPNLKHPMKLTLPESAARGPAWYHADYRDDFAYGDDPYRYYRW